MATEASSQQKAKAQPKGRAEKVTPYIPSGLEMVLMRNNFYQKNYRRMVTFSLFLTLILLGLGGFNFYQYYTRPTPKFFATTEDGKLLQLDPLTSPNKTINELFSWAKDAAISSFTYDFVNYRKELQDAKLFYTPAGHAQLLKAIQESRNLEAVKAKKMTTTARVMSNKPTIIAQGVSKTTNRYSWKIQFPMRVWYTNNNPQDQIVQDVMVTMLISRVPVWDSSMGIGIKSIVVREILPPKPRAG